MADQFPAPGHKYLVDFRADDGSGRFKVQLDFHSEVSLTYTGVKPDGTLGANSETVDITVEPIRDLLFLVTWKEKLGTTVVHLEDYRNNTIITSITDPGPDPSFAKFHGTMTQIS
jgi:MoaF-like